MITLILDTSTDKSLVVFADKRHVQLNFFLPIGNQSSRTLMSTIDTGFKQLNLTSTSLNAVAIGVGPGSYTGIRVAAAAAYGLTFANSLPLISFCSLEGFISNNEGCFASLIDARIGGAYVLLQERAGDKIYPLSTPQMISNENLENYLKGFPIRVGPHMDYPDPVHLASLVAQKMEKKEFSTYLELMYLRTPEYT